MKTMMFYRTIDFLRRQIPLFAAIVTAWFISGVFPDDHHSSGTWERTAFTESLPLSSPEKSDKKSERLQSEIPAASPAAIIIRRNSQSSGLRFFRTGNTATIIGKTVLLPVPFSCLEKHRKFNCFIFQRFLHHSLPPRAGPENLCS